MAATEELTITLTERDKRALKVKAAMEGRTMREIVRVLIQEAVREGVQNDG
jgi:hypothetical protein